MNVQMTAVSCPIFVSNQSLVGSDWLGTTMKLFHNHCNFSMIVNSLNMSRVMRKPAFCIC